jgi:hypothetical protein
MVGGKRGPLKGMWAAGVQSAKQLSPQNDALEGEPSPSLVCAPPVRSSATLHLATFSPGDYERKGLKGKGEQTVRG